MSKTCNPYAAPVNRPQGRLDLGRLAFLVVLGLAIGSAALVALFALVDQVPLWKGTIAEKLLEIPLPGDMPDPRAARQLK